MAVCPRTGRLAVECGAGAVLRVWDPASGDVAQTVSIQGYTIQSFNFSTDGKHLVLVPIFEKAIRLVDVATGKDVRTFPTATERGWQALLTPEGKNLVATVGAPGAGRVVVWDAANGREVWSRPATPGLPTALAVSPDGRLLAVAMSAGAIWVWDCADGKQLAVLREHSAAVTALTFTADGRTLISGSDDGSVKLWERKGLEVR